MRLNGIGPLPLNRATEQKVRPALPEQKRSATAVTAQLSLRFQRHHSSDRWMIQVVDVSRDEIVREIPSEQTLDVAAQMKDLIGNLRDEKC